MPFVQYSERENKVQRVLVASCLDSASDWLAVWAAAPAWQWWELWGGSGRKPEWV